jgi:Zn-dependent alcohol dehydrogenase
MTNKKSFLRAQVQLWEQIPEEPLRHAARHPQRLKWESYLITVPKLAAAKAFGAIHGVNPSQENAQEVVYSLTEEGGADYVFVTVGSVKAIEQGITFLRRDGTLVIVGMPASGTMAKIEAANFAGDSQRFLGRSEG